FFLQRAVILNNPIVYNGQPAVFGKMRVRIPVRRLTVCSPTGMANTGPALQVCTRCSSFQITYLARLLVMVNVLLIHQGNPCTVITPVFQPFESFYNNLPCFTLANVTYNSTHSFILNLSTI